MIEPEFQISAVFFSERGNRERGAGQVDALMLGQRAAVDDFALDVLTLYCEHA